MYFIILWLSVLTVLGVIFYLRYFLPPIITYKISSSLAKPPYRHKKSACVDLFAVKDVTIPSGQWREVPTGITFAPWPHIYIPFLNITFTPLGNIAYKIHSRSGLSVKRGVRVAHIGIMDNDYRGECSVFLHNSNPEYPVRIHIGHRIGQVEFFRVSTPIFWRRNKLSRTARGDRGHGSSGK